LGANIGYGKGKWELLKTKEGIRVSEQETKNVKNLSFKRPLILRAGRHKIKFPAERRKPTA